MNDVQRITPPVPAAAITAHTLRAFYSAQDGAVPIKAEATRLSRLVEVMVKSAVADMKVAVKDYLKTADGNPLKKGIDPEYQVSHQRASEARQLFGAIHFCGFVPADIGYSTAISTARKLLDERRIRWDSTPVQTKEQRQRQARRDAEMEVYEAALRARDDLQDRTGQDVTPDQMDELTAKAAAGLVKTRAERDVVEFLKRHGDLSYLEHFATALALGIKARVMEGEAAAKTAAQPEAVAQAA